MVPAVCREQGISIKMVFLPPLSPFIDLESIDTHKKYCVKRPKNKAEGRGLEN